MITLEHVSKIYSSRGQTVRAVDDVSLEVAEGELCVLIGPSGSGKTTTMRMINHLEVPTEGRIIVNGQDIAAMDDVQLRRSIGYVIQQGGLFPHFTVADNVSIVPRLLGWPAEKRRKRANELLDLVGLPSAQFGNRYPRQLSGGQQQRIGVARALATDPPIVLMDEPFGAVDPITRKQLQRELRRIQAEVHKTIVFVTHDISEAFLLGDRIVLMSDGRIVQEGRPSDLLRNPTSQFTTDFIGEDRGLRTLEYTTLAEIIAGVARPEGQTGLGPSDGVSLPGNLSVLEGLQRLGSYGDRPEEGVWVSDDNGGRVGYLTYNDLVVALGEALADGQPGERVEVSANGLPH